MTDGYFMVNAKSTAQLSNDPSTKVGCILAKDNKHMIACGWNGMPWGVDEETPSRWERPDKYEWVIHAEARAVASAAQCGYSLFRSTCYSTQMPCSSCMALLVESGISRVVCPSPQTLADKWKQNAQISLFIAYLGGVEVVYV